MRRVLRFAPILCLLAAACGNSTEIEKQTGSSTKKDLAAPEANCTSREAINILRDQIFDAAIAKVDDKGAIKLNSLRSAIAGRLENPIVRGHDPSLDRTECGGRIVFGLPPNTQRAFNNVPQIMADVSFSSQMAADKSGLVIEASGAESLIDTLIAGAKAKRKIVTRVGAGPGEEPPRLTPDFTNMFEAGDRPSVSTREFGDPLAEPAVEGPSFRCRGKLNSVERRICADPGLAAQDRVMVDAYRNARERTPAELRGKLEVTRRKYLAQRNTCSDSACITATYDAWTAALYDWNP